MAGLYKVKPHSYELVHKLLDYFSTTSNVADIVFVVGLPPLILSPDLRNNHHHTFSNIIVHIINQKPLVNYDLSLVLANPWTSLSPWITFRLPTNNLWMPTVSTNRSYQLWNTRQKYQPWNKTLEYPPIPNNNINHSSQPVASSVKYTSWTWTISTNHGLQPSVIIYEYHLVYQPITPENEPYKSIKH